MKKTNWLLIAITAAGIGAVIYYFLWIKSKKAKASALETTTETGANITPFKILSESEKNTILQKGSSGNLVKVLQRVLNEKETLGFVAPLQIDGVFGMNTEEKLNRIKGKTIITLKEFNVISYTPDFTPGYSA
jgi:predicted xylose isomerase-like sugar epimerase